MKRLRPEILIALGGLLLLPIIVLHLGAMLPVTTNLAVVAPWIAVAFYAFTIAGMALIVGGLTILALRRWRPLP
jgi:hypothetical protein